MGGRVEGECEGQGHTMRSESEGNTEEGSMETTKEEHA